MNKIIILGGGGFLGKYLFRELQKQGYSNLCCADITNPFLNGIEYVYVDIFSTDLKLIIKKEDIVINCIGQITYPINGCYRLNTSGIGNLVNSIRNSGAFLLHISTVAVYGTTDFADENTALNPETPYSACKAIAEHLIQSGLPSSQYCILRLSNLFAEEQKKGVFSYLLKSYFSDKKLIFNNNGNLYRYFLHTGDCSKIIVDLIKVKGKEGIYNLVGKDKYSLKELIKLSEDIINTKYAVFFDSAKPYDNTYDISDKKIHSLINIKFERSVEDYFRNNFRDRMIIKAENYRKYCCTIGSTIKEVMSQIDQIHIGATIVIDKNGKLIGTITDGDIRRGILKGMEITENIEKVMNTNPIFVVNPYHESELEKLFVEKQICFIPLVNENHQLIDIFLRKNVI